MVSYIHHVPNKNPILKTEAEVHMGREVMDEGIAEAGIHVDEETEEETDDELIIIEGKSDDELLPLIQ